MSSSTCVKMHVFGCTRTFSKDRSVTTATAVIHSHFCMDPQPSLFHICRSRLIVESIIRRPIVTVHVHAMHAHTTTPDKWEIPGCRALASPRYTRWRFQTVHVDHFFLAYLHYNVSIIKMHQRRLFCIKRVSIGNKTFYFLINFGYTLHFNGKF